MKRLLLLGLLASAALVVAESTASAFGIPPGIGGKCRRVGRVEGYWLQPTRGPLYDYSSYFATMYPYMPGAQEYQWQPTGQYGAFGTSVAVLPSAPPPARNTAPPLAPATPPSATPAPAPSAPIPISPAPPINRSIRR